MHETAKEGQNKRIQLPPAVAREGVNMTRRPVSRVLFPAPSRDIGSATIPLRQASQPASRDTPGARAEDIPYAPPTWSCSRRGLPCRDCYQPRGGLLPHPFTLTSCRSGRRSALCGTFPRLAPGGHYPPPCLPGARTFLQWQVTPPPAAARPSGHPAHIAGNVPEFESRRAFTPDQRSGARPWRGSARPGPHPCIYSRPGYRGRARACR